MDLSLKDRYTAARRRIIDDFFSRMNPMQKQAVYTLNGPVLILAGAGSGKTTVIINRIANMVLFGDAYHSTWMPEQVTAEDVAFLEEYADGESWDSDRAFTLIRSHTVMPWNILAITFTNKAAGELRERLSAMLGRTADDVGASTFHSACVRILRREIERLGYGRSFAIYDTDDSLRVIKGALKELNIDDKRFAPKGVLSAIGRAKDELLTPDGYEAGVGDDYYKQVVAKVYAIYQKQLQDANAVDFDDIIMLTVRLFKEFPEALDYYQQPLPLHHGGRVPGHQPRAVRARAACSPPRARNLCVVGDDDQSIYKFRGATIENILQFEDNFPGAKVFRLEQNYRSTETILDAANAVISNNTERKGKTLWTQNGEGVKVRVHRAADENGEAQFICDTIQANVQAGAKYSDHAVLYRMNAQSQMLERGIRQGGHPLPYHRRAALLRAQGDQGYRLLSERAEQPVGFAAAAADHQRAQAEDRRQHGQRGGGDRRRDGRGDVRRARARGRIRLPRAQDRRPHGVRGDDARADGGGGHAAAGRIARRAARPDGLPCDAPSGGL